jgi:hypothetical protein
MSGPFELVRSDPAYHDAETAPQAISAAHSCAVVVKIGCADLPG